MKSVLVEKQKRQERLYKAICNDISNARMMWDELPGETDRMLAYIKLKIHKIINKGDIV